MLKVGSVEDREGYRQQDASHHKVDPSRLGQTTKFTPGHPRTDASYAQLGSTVGLSAVHIVFHVVYHLECKSYSLKV